MVQALPVVLQLPPVVLVAWAGGPRAPPPLPALSGAPMLVPDVRGRPVHLAPPAQSRVAEAADHLDAPGTDAAPELAADPGDPAGGNAASFPPGPCPPGFCSSGLWSPAFAPFVAFVPDLPVVSPVRVVWVVALSVDWAVTIGAIEEASGPEEAPELLTA